MACLNHTSVQNTPGREDEVDQRTLTIQVDETALVKWRIYAVGESICLQAIIQD
jgi:hypothetical protein